MTDYTKTTDFAAKDALPSGDPNKIIRGSEFEAEFDNIETAVNSKADSSSPTITGSATAVNLSVSGALNSTGDLQIDGTTITATAAELNYVDGVTSNIQTQLNAKLESVAIDDVTDITITTPADNEVLAYDTGTGEWINQTASEAGLATSSQGALADTALQDGDTVSSLTITSADINGGTIDGTVIGGSTPAAITGTTASFSGDLAVGTDKLFVDVSTGNVGIDNSGPDVALSVGGNDSNADGKLGIGFWNNSDNVTAGGMFPIRGGLQLFVGNGLKSSDTVSGSFEHTAGFYSGIAFNNNPNSTLQSIRFLIGQGGALGTDTSSPVEAMRIDSGGTLLSPSGQAFVGTVSNSGNGAIIERGSNANGEYVKFADGTMICFKRHVTSSQTVSSGSVITFGGVATPATFASTPSVSSAYVAGNAGDLLSLVESPSTTQFAGILFIRNFATGSYTRQFTVELIAVGRWF